MYCRGSVADRIAYDVRVCCTLKLDLAINAKNCVCISSLALVSIFRFPTLVVIQVQGMLPFEGVECHRQTYSREYSNHPLYRFATMFIADSISSEEDGLI